MLYLTRSFQAGRVYPATEMKDGGWEQQMLLERLQAPEYALAVLRDFTFLVSFGGTLAVQGSTPGAVRHSRSDAWD